MRRLKRFDEVDLAQKLEGIRFALLSVKRAFARIETYCRDREAQDQNTVEFMDCFDLLCDCWQVVDGADRARFLVESVPSWNRQKDERRAFTKSMVKVRDFRNIYHHFGNKAKALPEKSSTVMGSLSWKASGIHIRSLTLLIDTGAVESSVPSLTFDRVENRFVGDFMFCVGLSQVSLCEISSACDAFSTVLVKMFQDADIFDEGDAGALIIGFEVRPMTDSDQRELSKRRPQ